MNYTTVNDYSDNGWISFPLPENEKFPPPVNATGNVPEQDEDDSRAFWEGVSGKSNLGLRMRNSVIALDIDHYGEKKGADTLKELEEQLGELPATVRSTRRGPNSPSGHLFYRVPENVKWKSELGNGIDIVQMTHRYCVAYPSVVDGEPYRWYDSEGSEIDIPNVDDLPDLPEAWQAHLKKGQLTAADSVPAPARGYSDALGWLEGRVFGGESAQPVPIDWAKGSRYDQMTARVMSLVSKAVHLGATGVIEDLHALRVAYVAEVGKHRAEEFERATVDAVAKVEGEIASGAEPDINWLEAFGEPPVGFALPNFSELLKRPVLHSHASEGNSLEDVRAKSVAALEARALEDYWQTQSILSDIAHYATRAGIDKYALLFRVLTYLSSELPPEVYLEDYRQSLTLFSAVIAESGAGKGVLDTVAEALVTRRFVNGELALRPGTGNMHTLLTAFGDFTRQPDPDEHGDFVPLPKHRMLIQGNELAAWAEMQGNAEWGGVMADVFDGQGDYEVRAVNNCYHFGVDQHSLAVTFSVQPDAARYLFASTGRGLPGRFLISALPPQERILPDDFDPWDLSSDMEVDTFDPARDVQALTIKALYFSEKKPFRLSNDAKTANARLKRAWDEGHGEYASLRAEKIFSQMPKVRLRVAVLLSVLLDFAEDREVPLKALRMADYFLKVSVENTRYARSLAASAERSKNATQSAERKRADSDADLTLAKEDVLSVIDNAKSGRAGLGTIGDRKRATKEHHAPAVAELLAEGVIKEIASTKGHPPSYQRVKVDQIR